MKKTTRVLVALLALTLVTSCFVGGTFAKYVTTAEGSDTARVAKFGVVLETESNIFAPQYDADDSISVLADDLTDVVAPGTEGEMVAFTIDGAPEVDVQFDISLDTEDALSMVTLPAAEYANWTTADPDDTYETTEAYYPVVWTLKKDGADVVSGNLETIEAYLSTNIAGKYEVEDGDFANIVGEYTLAWTWEFETGHDAEDTTLGQMAAGIETQGAAILTEAFGFKVTATQVD